MQKTAYLDAHLEKWIDSLNLREMSMRAWREDNDNSFQGGLVILDGPRGVGKSTLCKTIVDELRDKGYNAVYYKKGAPADDEHNNMQQHLAIFSFVARVLNIVVVVDRFVATEYVFANFLNRATAEDIDTYCQDIMQNIDTFFDGLPVYHRVLLAPINEIAARLEARVNKQLQNGEPVRSWDMPKEIVIKKWNKAANQLGLKLRLNETPTDSP